MSEENKEDPIKIVINGVYNKIAPMLKNIEEKLKIIEEANKISMDDFDIDGFIKHTLECPACKKRLENSLNKYYKVIQIGGRKERTRK